MEYFHNLCKQARAADSELDAARESLIEKANEINKSLVMYAKNKRDLDTMNEVGYIWEKTINTRIPGIHRDFNNEAYIDLTFGMAKYFRGTLYIHKSVHTRHVNAYRVLHPRVPLVTHVLIMGPRGG